MSRDTVDIALDDILDRLAGNDKRPFVVGICGAQGSGKSWLTERLATRLTDIGLRVAALSIDDLYLTQAERAERAAAIHPLLAVRGVPGTHDVALGLTLLDALGREGEVALPRFDKARDDRAPRSDWKTVSAPVDVILFEGWCVGARPQPEAQLAAPVNALEAVEDAAGRWRHHVNAALAGPYQALFERIDMLILLQAPGFEIVLQWRIEQEDSLRKTLGERGQLTDEVMDSDAIARFIRYYERLTRHILHEMPTRADLVIPLDAQRHPLIG